MPKKKADTPLRGIGTIANSGPFEPQGKSIMDFRKIQERFGGKWGRFICRILPAARRIGKIGKTPVKIS